MQWAQLAIMFLGEEKAGKLSQQQLELLGKQYADMAGISLPDLQKMTPDQLGPSAVGSMTSDEGMRGKQLQALGDIQNVIDSGGLDLTDKASLEEAFGAAANQQRRARAGVEADAAARGGLNSGSRLVMDMDAASRGSNEARKNALDTAGMAQRRRLDMIRESSGIAAGLREQDWREKESAGRAKDMRDQLNASAREKAQYYNAALPQQQFNNQLSKVTGQQPAVNALAGGYAGAAADKRAQAAGYAGVAGAYPSSAGADTGGGYQYTADLEGYRGGASDLSRDRSLAEDDQGAGFK